MHWVAAIAGSLALAGPAGAEMIAAWNFNTNDGDLYNWVADHGAGTLTLDVNWTQMSVGTGTTLNAQLGDPAGDALNFKSNENNGRDIDFLFDATGYEDIQFSFDATRNTQGFNGNQVWYSVDGSNYFLFDIFNPATSFGTHSFDMSSITALDDAANAYIRIRFNGAGNNGGMNRLDNVVIGGSAVPAPSALALLGGALALAGRRRRRYPRQA